MTDPPRVTHKDIIITYYEDSNTWESTHGSASSLSQAKAKIDTFLRKERAFAPFTAYRISLGSHPIQLTVTSVDQDGTPWVKENNSRSKCLHTLFANTPLNLEKMEMIRSTKEQIESLEAKIKDLIGTMEKVEIPKKTLPIDS